VQLVRLADQTSLGRRKIFVPLICLRVASYGPLVVEEKIQDKVKVSKIGLKYDKTTFY